MNKKAFLGLLVVVVTLVVATAGCTSSTTPSSASASPSASAVPSNIAGYATYTNATAGVRLQYPSGWKVTEGGGTAMGVVKFNGPDGTNVLLIKGRYTGSLEDAKNGLISGLLNDTTLNYTLVSTEKTTLAGVPAYNVTLTTTYLGVNMKQIVQVVVKDNQGYNLTHTAVLELRSKYQNDFSNISSSFTITS